MIKEGRWTSDDMNKQCAWLEKTSHQTRMSTWLKVMAMALCPHPSPKDTDDGMTLYYTKHFQRLSADYCMAVTKEIFRKVRGMKLHWGIPKSRDSFNAHFVFAQGS